MDVSKQRWIAVHESSVVGAMRREVDTCAQHFSLDRPVIERLRLIVSEVGTNIVSHAGSGFVALIPAPRERTVTVLAIDSGPGIQDMPQSLRDGYSGREKSAGLGLGALKRLADHFEIFTTVGKGTVIRCTIQLDPEDRRPPRPACLVEGLNRPCVGETISGDQWRIRREQDVTWILLADGLGHGSKANIASEAAAEVFLAERFTTPEDCVEQIHRHLRSTRGAAAGVLRIDHLDRAVRFCGVGNTEAYFQGFHGRTGHLVSRNGTLGHSVRKLEACDLAWPVGSCLVMNSDGLSTRATLRDLPDLKTYTPLMIAAVLMRDFGKTRDDCSVVVAHLDPDATC